MIINEMLIESYEKLIVSINRTLKMSKIASVLILIAISCYSISSLIYVMEGKIANALIYLLVILIFTFLLKQLNNSKKRSIEQIKRCELSIKELQEESE